MIIFLLKEWKTGKNIIQSQKTSMTQKLGRETTSEMSDTILEDEMSGKFNHITKIYDKLI